MQNTTETPTIHPTGKLTGRRLTASQGWDSDLGYNSLTVGARAHAVRTTCGVGTRANPSVSIQLVAGPRWAGHFNDSFTENLGLVEVVKVLNSEFGEPSRYQVRRFVEG